MSSTQQTNNTGLSRPELVPVGTEVKRNTRGEGICDVCGTKFKKLSEHYRERHIGNYCQWPMGPANADGSLPTCADVNNKKFKDDQELWAHLVEQHTAILWHSDWWNCYWPAHVGRYRNKHSAERLIRFKQHDTFHENAALQAAGNTSTSGAASSSRN